MNPSTQDEIQGTVHEVKGKIKETAGKVTNSSNLEAEGIAEKNTGKVEKKGRADRKSVREVNLMVSAWRSEYCTGRATLLRLTGRPLDARIHSAKPVDNHCPIHCTFIVRKYPRSEVADTTQWPQYPIDSPCWIASSRKVTG